tara:strand:- start:134 stop:424 length:291 start_codon:yes stop_codon:yes gene_type:complete
MENAAGTVADCRQPGTSLNAYYIYIYLYSYAGDEPATDGQARRPLWAGWSWGHVRPQEQYTWVCLGQGEHHPNETTKLPRRVMEMQMAQSSLCAAD